MTFKYAKKENELKIEIGTDIYQNFISTFREGYVFNNESSILLQRIGFVIIFISILFTFFYIKDALLGDPAKLDIEGSTIQLALLLGSFFIALIFIFTSSINFPEKIFIIISKNGINIYSNKNELGTLHIEKNNVRNIMDKPIVNRYDIIAHNVYLYLHTPVMTIFKQYKNKIFLFHFINHDDDAIFLVEEAKRILNVK